MLFDNYLRQTKKNYAKFKKELVKADSFFPRKDVCLEALVQSFYDEQTLVKKRSLDFIINYMNIETEQSYFVEKDYIVLINQALLSLNTTDLSSKRRIFKYIFGPETDEEEVVFPEKNMNLLVSALRLILSDTDPKN